MENKERIEKEFAFYKLREVDIEDMKLKIRELESREELGSPGFEERVQASAKCKNNDEIMNKVEMLSKKIELYEISNKRIDNSMKMLEEIEKDIIIKLLIEKKSISRTSAESFKSRKSVKKIKDRAFEKIRFI